MNKLVALLSCGHFVERDGTEWTGDATPVFREQKRLHHDVNCFGGGDHGGHESFVTKILTSNVDRIWIEEL